jgi:ATP-binding cassette subfamily F protein 3
MTDALSFKGVDLCAGPKQLLCGADFSIGCGDRIVVLGRNGCGKTTLFTWLSNQKAELPWSVYQVAQELPPTQQTPVQIVLGAHLERGTLWVRQTELETQEAELTEAEAAEYRDVGESLSAMRADADPARVRRILAGLGFSLHDMERPLTEFSGGWRARVALAQGLFMEPDMLLLDEPTNHLDLDGVLWLTAYLTTEWRSSLAVISHNRGFVSEVGTAVWHIEGGRMRTYRCKYGRYVKQLELDRAKAASDWTAHEKEVGALRRKGSPAARAAADELDRKRNVAGVCRPAKVYAPKFFFAPVTPVRDGLLLAAAGATLGYVEDVPVLADVRFALHQGCRVALVGSNGSGKSTLLKFLAGALPALNEDAAVTRRPGLRVAAFDQHFYHSLPDEQTPLEYLIRCDGGSSEAAARRFLGASGLEGAAHERAIGTLSGGQKARVYFAGLALQAPDILLMDEPTNHLDMETVGGLAAALADFGGAALIVSHDVDFLEEVATEVWVCGSRRVRPLGEGTDGIGIYADRVLEAMEASV